MPRPAPRTRWPLVVRTHPVSAQKVGSLPTGRAPLVVRPWPGSCVPRMPRHDRGWTRSPTCRESARAGGCEPANPNRVHDREDVTTTVVIEDARRVRAEVLIFPGLEPGWPRRRWRCWTRASATVEEGGPLRHLRVSVSRRAVGRRGRPDRSTPDRIAPRTESSACGSLRACRGSDRV